MKKTITVGMMLMALMTFMIAGCYGPFRLTKKLHAWNGEIPGKWPREGVFLLLVVVPAYSFSALADAVIFNSIEFWTGKNPIAKASEPSEKVVSQGDQKAVLKYLAEKNRLGVETFQGQKALGSFSIEPAAGGGMVVKDKNGEIQMRSMVTPDGVLIAQDNEGKIVAYSTVEQADKVIAQHMQ